MSYSASAHVPQVVGRYRLGERLGLTKSGRVFRAFDTVSKRTVALKVQPITSRPLSNNNEREFYAALEGGEGISTLYDTDQVGGHDFLAMPLYGESLEEIRAHNGNQPLDAHLVSAFVEQALSSIEFIHSRGAVHGNVSPANFVVGRKREDENTIHLINFAASRYIDDRTLSEEDINPWFSSVRVHCDGQAPGIRDDMESLALVAIHLATPGGLPWTRRGPPLTRQDLDDIIASKFVLGSDDLCKDTPLEFERFLEYCRTIRHNQPFDYEYWREVFRQLRIRRGFPDDNAFTWVRPAPRSSLGMTLPSQAPRPRHSSPAPSRPFDEHLTSSSFRPGHATPPSRFERSLLFTHADVTPSASCARTPTVPLSTRQTTPAMSPVVPNRSLRRASESLQSAFSTHNSSPSPSLYDRGATRASSSHARASHTRPVAPIRGGIPLVEVQSDRDDEDSDSEDEDDASSDSTAVDDDDDDDDDDDAPVISLPPPMPRSLARYDKKQQLYLVVSKVQLATENKQIAQAVNDFIGILRISGYMSFEAFKVLESLQQVLYKVITVDAVRGTKLAVAKRLSVLVLTARKKKELASMIAEFSAVMSIHDKRMTKDGFEFLEGLAARLTSLPRKS